MAVSYGASLWAVEAGSVNAATGVVDIGKLRGKNNANPLKICPEDYLHGFSIECRGADVNPRGGVEFIVNGNRVQTEWISPPYMIAGDLDRGPAGVTFINPWVDWMEVNNRCGNRNRNCKLNIKCSHAGGSITKQITIKKSWSIRLLFVTAL